MLVFLLSSFLLNYGLAVNVSDYASWQPDQTNGFTYCEAVQGTGTVGGFACGGVSYKKMQAADSSVAVVGTGGSLGLLKIEWIARRAISDKDFYNTCKQYFVRLYDTLYKNYSSTKCILTFPKIDGLITSCNDTTNVLMRPGSGYCMSEPVCGASKPIYFLSTPDNTSNIYTWIDGVLASLNTIGYKEVGKCYGYAIINETTPLDTTILKS